MLVMLLVGRPRNQHLWRSRSSAKSTGVVGVTIHVVAFVGVVGIAAVVLHVPRQQKQGDFRMTPLHLPVAARGPHSGLAGIL